MKIPSFCAAVMTLSLLIPSIKMANAATVAEWKFDGSENLGGGQIVPLDTAAENASTQSLLMTDASYSASSTALGDKWQPFLATGYLDTGSRSGKDSAGACGLVTKNTTLPEDKIYPGGDASYRAYMGFIGFGSGTSPVLDGIERPNGGTVYLVVSPNSAWTESRAGLMATGHIGGSIALSVSGGELSLRVGSVGSGGQSARSVIKAEWAPDRWYFIAASWTEGQPPLLFVREMDPAGAAGSPAALTGESDGPIPQGLPHPEHDPIALGAQWINTGADNTRFTQDGGNARIAYARIDNVYSSPEDMAKVFDSLASAQ